MKLPKIYFVKEMGLPCLRRGTQGTKDILTGQCHYDDNRVYILKINRRHDILVLLHELTHWFLFRMLYCRAKTGVGDLPHRMLDKYMSVSVPQDAFVVIHRRQQWKLCSQFTL